MHVNAQCNSSTCGLIITPSDLCEHRCGDSILKLDEATSNLWKPQKLGSAFNQAATFVDDSTLRVLAVVKLWCFSGLDQKYIDQLSFFSVQLWSVPIFNVLKISINSTF